MKLRLFAYFISYLTNCMLSVYTQSSNTNNKQYNFSQFHTAMFHGHQFITAYPDKA